MDLGRGFYYQTEATDAARDATRVLIAPSNGTGPGLSAACTEAQRDLYNVGIGNVSCTQMTSHAPPYLNGTDYTAPALNQALVLVWCGEASDCTTVSGSSGLACDTNSSPHTCVGVTVIYSFALLSPQIKQIGGPSILLQDSAEMVSLW